MHTALRIGEMRRAQWADVDTQARVWEIPAENTKMRREHRVPLTEKTLDLLEELRVISENHEWLFPDQQGRVHPFMSENTINHLVKRMGYQGRLVGHGFRALFSSVLNEQGFNRDAIERQLAHVESNQVRAAYNRAEYWEERWQMMT